VIEIEDCFIRDLETRIAESSGFQGVTHKLEFFGICPACQSPAG
jgi:Fe2+ or Zn2+ uptake regulation protein